jgi:IS605 OrfB family transposase
MLDKQNIKMNIIFNNLNRKIDDNLNWSIIRTKNLKEIRDKIIEQKYINHLGKKTQIKTHIIDTAIKMACTAYKSCKSNFMSGYIKKFRVKFWRYNKIRKILEIEAEYINKNKQICEQTLGKIKYTYKTDFFNKETQKYTKKIQKYILEEKTVKILYDKSSNKYQLLVAEDVDKIKTNITKFIGIDQGIRTFASCITNNEVIEIGTSIDELIKKYLLRIDKINNNDKIETIKKTIKCAKYMRKLKNKIEDIHWKTINYLTNNYKTIIIGDLSMKDASNNKTSKISNMTKRIGLMMSHFKFRQRLQYKCTIKGINLKIVDEWGTSKTCSFCGNFKAELKGEHIYECNVCKKHIGRDIGSSRNILFIGTRSNNI